MICLKEERNYNLDLIKSIAIFLVCLCHCCQIPYDIIKDPNLSSFLYYFCRCLYMLGAPILFMVNGALLLNKEFDFKKHIFKTIKILILFLFWGVINNICHCIVNNDINFTFKNIIILSWTDSYDTLGRFWFLYALFFIYLIFPIIKYFYDNKIKYLFYYILIFTLVLTFGVVLLNNLFHMYEFMVGTRYIGLIVYNFFQEFNFLFYTYGYSLVYFMFGGVLYKLIYAQSYPFNKKILIGAATFSQILIFLYAVVMTHLFGYVYDLPFDAYNTLMCLIANSCVFILLNLIKLNNKYVKSFVYFVGSNVFGVYILHEIIYVCTSNLFNQLTFSSYPLAKFIYTIIIYLLSALIAAIMKRFKSTKTLVTL